MPYNCGRKCPFCESRKMYDTLDVSLDKTLEVLRRIADSDIEDIMITGGEPCDNLDYLGKMPFSPPNPQKTSPTCSMWNIPA